MVSGEYLVVDTAATKKDLMLIECAHIRLRLCDSSVISLF